MAINKYINIFVKAENLPINKHVNISDSEKKYCIPLFGLVHFLLRLVPTEAC